MFICHVQLCTYGMYIFFPHIVTTQNMFQNAYNLIEYDQQIRQSNMKTLTRRLSTLEVRNANGIYQTNGDMQVCSEIYNRSLQSSNHKDVNVYGYSDSVSTNDLVKKQYSILPYPTVGYDTIRREHMYYLSDNSNYPISSHYSLKLEYLNHYLYQGQNNFEYVFILNHNICIWIIFIGMTTHIIFLQFFIQIKVSNINTRSWN